MEGHRLQNEDQVAVAAGQATVAANSSFCGCGTGPAFVGDSLSTLCNL
jgi:hypothetical protein